MQARSTESESLAGQQWWNSGIRSSDLVHASAEKISTQANRRVSIEPENAEPGKPKIQPFGWSFVKERLQRINLAPTTSSVSEGIPPAGKRIARQTPISWNFMFTQNKHRGRSTISKIPELTVVEQQTE